MGDRAAPLTAPRPKAVVAANAAAPTRTIRSIEAPRRATAKPTTMAMAAASGRPPWRLARTESTSSAATMAAPACRIARSKPGAEPQPVDEEQRHHPEHVAGDAHGQRSRPTCSWPPRREGRRRRARRRRPPRAGRCRPGSSRVNRDVAAAARQTQRVSGSTKPRRHEADEAQRYGDSEAAGVEPASEGDAGRHHRRPPDAEGEAGGEEEPALVRGHVGGWAGLGHRPRGIDDQRRGGEPEPGRLACPPAGERGAVDEQPGVDQHAGQDGDHEARAAETLQCARGGSCRRRSTSSRTIRPRSRRGRPPHRWPGRTARTRR